MSTFSNNRNNRSGGAQLRNLVIIAGYYGIDNLGDEAILEELLNELDSFCARQEMVVLSQNAEKTASLYKVKSISRWNWFGYLKLLRKTKLLISGGGGLFQDRTGLGSVIFYGAQILLARLCGAKVLIYAQGLGPLRSIFSKTLTRLAFSQSHCITVRDTNSLSLIEEWGLTAHLTADPVWSLRPASLLEPAQALLDAIRVNNAKRMIVGLSIRNDLNLQNHHLESLAKGLANSLPSDSAVLLLPLQMQQDQAPLQTIEQFLIKSNLGTYWLDPNILTGPSQWLALFENIDILVGMRFHALLMALKAGKPVLGIAYDQKVSHLLNLFEQPSLSLSTDEFQCKTAWPAAMEHALINKETLATVAKAQLNAITQSADQNKKFLAEILEVGTTSDVTSNYH